MNHFITNKSKLMSFEEYLKRQNLSENTILAYASAIAVFFHKHEKISQTELNNYRDFLLKKYSPKTVNLKIQGINRYLSFIHKEKLQLKFVKIQQKTYLENVISEQEYLILKNRLKTDGKIKWYFIVWFLAATGLRVGELVKLHVQDIHKCYMEIYSKAQKCRRVYIPQKLYCELFKWLASENRKSGFLFTNRFGSQLTTRGIAIQLKTYANEYGINPVVVHPHSFRHFFAKQFLQKCPDITFLADLLGHENLATTRIYLRRTSDEQQQLVNKTVTW